MSESLPPWRQTFSVHSFDVDSDGRLAPRALCAFLQEAAGRDAAQRGVGMAELMARGLAWVLQRLVVVVDEWPEEGSIVTVSTWPTRFGGATAERGFTVEDGNGRPLTRAASRWAVADLAARRAVRLPEFMRRLPTGGIPPVLELPPFPAREANLAVLGERTLVVRRADLDRVGHANNTRYVEWGLEAVPDEWSKTRVLSGFDIVYRREALYGDTLETGALTTDDGLRLSHELRLLPSQEPLAELVTRWRPR